MGKCTIKNRSFHYNKQRYNRPEFCDLIRSGESPILDKDGIKCLVRHLVKKTTEKDLPKKELIKVIKEGGFLAKIKKLENKSKSTTL